MTTYITEAEYEKRFNRWAKGRSANTERAASYLQGMIESGSRRLATIALESPAAATREIKRLMRESSWSALRAEFENAFVVHPTGMDKNAIAFYVPSKPCHYCGSVTHPVGCCAQDGHGG